MNVHLIHIKYDLTKILNRWCCLSSNDYRVYKRTLCHMGRQIFCTYSCSDQTSIATAAAEETEKSIHYSFAPHTHTHTLKVYIYRYPILYYIKLYYACVAGIVRVTDSSFGKARVKEKNQLPTPATRNMFRYTPEGLHTHYVYIHIFVCVALSSRIYCRCVADKNFS